MISVCMATYNGAKYIQQQIDSILRQLTDVDELIISDDGSTDGTIKIIENYHSPIIKLLNHKKKIEFEGMDLAPFLYASDNFQNALLYAKGDYIFLSDQDDIWEDNKIEIMKKILDTNDLAVCNFSVIDTDNNVLISTYHKKNPISKYFLCNILYPSFWGCTMGFRRKVLNYCMPFPAVAHDIWIGLLISLKGKYQFIDTPLHKRRKHDTNLSPILTKSTNSLFCKIKYRFFLVVKIVCRLIKS